jgi:hypothetical protein
VPAVPTVQLAHPLSAYWADYHGLDIIRDYAVGEEITVTEITEARLIGAGYATGAEIVVGIEVDRLLAMFRSVKDPAYAAAGDDSTDDYNAIVAADADAAAAGGGVVFFPPGKYRTSAELRPSKNNTWLSAFVPPRWPYATGLVPAAYIKPLSTFTGTAAIRLRDMVEGGYGSEQGNITIEGLCIDLAEAPTGTHGIHATGLVKAVKLRDLTIRLAPGTGTGIRTAVYNRSGTNYYPRGWEFDRVVVNACGGPGFLLDLMTDAVLRDCLAVGNGGSGFDLNGPGETKLIGCFAPFNGAKGYRFVGETAGNVQIIGCSTDRNQEDGFYVGGMTGMLAVDPSGGVIQFIGCAAGRDGKNNNLGGGNWAGFATNNTRIPVIYTDCTTHPGVEDDGSGVQSPQHAGRFTGSHLVEINGGFWWGATGLINDGGGNTRVLVGPIAVGATGPATAAPVLDPAFGGLAHLYMGGRSLGMATPADQGLAAWTFDPALPASGKAGIAGTQYLAAVYVPRRITATKLMWGINTAGASPVAGQNFVGLYNAAGTRLASVGVDARVTTTGVFTETISVDLAPGLYWVAFVFNASTMPQVYRGNDLNATLANANLAAANLRFATNGTGRTSLPTTITPGSNVAAQFVYWAAVG